MERRPVVIVGSGPAGSATALYLHAIAPDLARDILILEKAQHPRPKVCAGGLVPHSLACLAELGVALDVPPVPVHRSRVAVPGRVVHYEGRDICHVVRRDEFDAVLVATCRARGIEVREGTRVTAVGRDGSLVRVETDRGTYVTPVVVAADGSGSIVRRHLLPDAPEKMGRAVMCDVPVARAAWDGFAADRYDFTFTAVPNGLRGYAWAFPCRIHGAPHVNVGVYSVNAARSHLRVAPALAAELERCGAPQTSVKAFPIRWYAPGMPLAGPNFVLVGDAAGVDPLMGEGISFAFEYGRRAAAAIAAALVTGDLSFRSYAAAVESSWFGKKLRRLELITRLFYGPTWRFWFGVAASSRRAQEVGIRWYNGVDGWDQRSGWTALWTILSGRGAPPVLTAVR